MSILKSHRARMKLNPMLAQWWKQASADEQVAWFCRQTIRQTLPGRSRDWDDFDVEQYQKRTTGQEERVRVHWQPYDEF